MYLGRLDEDGFAKLTHLPFVLYLGTMVRDGLAHMRGVTWQAVPAKFKTGMCEMKKFGFEVRSVSWDVGSGWVGTHAWCNMESCSGKVQKRDVCEMKILGSEVLWCIFGTLIQGWHTCVV